MSVSFVPVSNAGHALIDAVDVPLVCRHKWHAIRSKYGHVYAAAKIGGRKVLMHVMIAGTCGETLCDHRNGDTLDNRRDNLRPADDCQNQWNRAKRSGRSKFKGVCFHNQSGKWMARIACRGKRVNIGLFESEESAAKAYDLMAVDLFGEFARLNFESQASSVDA